jgi:endonuclease YncB( thermonuclease family)
VHIRLTFHDRRRAACYRRVVLSCSARHSPPRGPAPRAPELGRTELGRARVALGLVALGVVGVGCDGGVAEVPDAGFFAIDSGVDAGPRPDLGVIGENTVQVQLVFDGDTARVSAGSSVMTPDGQRMAGQSIRFIGINAPEIAHAPDPAECFGDSAADFTRDLLQGRVVTLTYDITAGCPTPVPRDQAVRCHIRDDFDRLLAYITLSDGTVVNEKLVRDGIACSFRSFPHRDLALYEAAESEAERAGRGLWRDCRCTPAGGAVNPR